MFVNMFTVGSNKQVFDSLSWLDGRQESPMSYLNTLMGDGSIRRAWRHIVVKCNVDAAILEIWDASIDLCFWELLTEVLN